MVDVASADLTGTTFESCSSLNAGAIHMDNVASADITGSTFESCSAAALTAYGGAIHMAGVASADFTGTTFSSCTAVRVVCSGPLTCYSTLWLAPLSRSTYTILSMFSLGKSVVENNFLDKSRSTHTLQPKPRTARCPWSWIRCAGLPVVMMI